MKNKINKIGEYKPAVSNNLLLLMAGTAWVLVGASLLTLACSWLAVDLDADIYLFAGAGVMLGLVAHHFGFLKIADKNLSRILAIEEKKCLFSFIPWKSYLIIAVMVTTGAVLRHSEIPKQYLAILYVGIGLALMLSSIRYLRVLVREIRRRRSA